MDERDNRIIEFRLVDGLGNEYSSTVNEILLDDIENELEFYTNHFRNFLITCGYLPAQVSAIQYLEDDEWKEVLTRYGEWNEYYERIYKVRKEVKL